MEIFLGATVLFLIALIPARIASSKGKNFANWWLYGVALFIVALVHALLLQTDSAELERRALAVSHKKCPQCAEVVKREAKVCRFCQYDFEVI